MADRPQDVPEEAVKAVAATLLRHYDSEYGSSRLTWKDFAEQARELLTAAAPHIERQVREQVASEARFAASQVGRHSDFDWDVRTLLWFADRLGGGR